MMDDELYMVPYSCPISISSSSSNFVGDGNSNSSIFMSDHNHHQEMVPTTGNSSSLAETHEMVMTSDIFKAQIASHPLYSNLLSAYIDCRKVGAPPEMASLLEEISKGNQHVSNCIEIGADPELDEFMISYCEVLHKYKEELSKPFDEATSFLSRIQSQLTNLCKETLPPSITSSLLDDDEIDWGDVEATHDSQNMMTCDRQLGDHQLKEMLMKKYSGCLSSLKTEFLKKRKKGKLPKDARNALLEWWNSHYRWPYPTEEEKNRLTEMTGLNQKQINNWFINQRKRHWKPSEDMRFALDMEMEQGPSGTGGLN